MTDAPKMVLTGSNIGMSVVADFSERLSAAQAESEALRAQIATARADALREAAEICDEECHNLNALTCNPPKSAAAWGARNRILALIDKETDAPDWKGFGKAIMENWAEHGDIEAGEKFDLARKFNILREIPGGFNPEHHVDEFGDAEPGDPWYEVNDTPALHPEAQGVKVRELEWQPYATDGSTLKADTDLAFYVVWEIQGVGHLATQQRQPGRSVDGGLEAAKAAAQADFDARILSALDRPEAQDGVANEPCGGCGESDPQKRCVGCLHDFGDQSSKWAARLARAEDK